MGGGQGKEAVYRPVDGVANGVGFGRVSGLDSKVPSLSAGLGE